jgi:hypothetical protein
MAKYLTMVVGKSIPLGLDSKAFSRLGRASYTNEAAHA